MSKIFEFNGKRDGSYIDPISGAVGTNTNGEWVRTEKGLAWKGNGSNTYLEFALSLSISSGYSLEAWAKLSEDGSVDHIFSSDNQSASERAWQLRFDATGEIRFISFDPSNAVIGNFTTTEQYNDGDWHHIITTYDTSAGSKIYVDGVLAATDTNNGTSNDVDSFVGVGYTYSAAVKQDSIDGYVANASVFDHVLTESERAKLYSEFLNAHPITKTIR